jgi:type IV pilus assembly protein PilA
MKKVFKGLMGKSKKKQKGMTLVELLAVIVILGIVAAIGTVAIGNIIENSRTKAEARKLDMMEEAAKMYHMDNASATGDVATAIENTYYDGDTDGYTVTITKNGTTVTYVAAKTAPAGN